jgi:molybdopterin molybdotransferase
MKSPLRPVSAAEARRILAGAGRVTATEVVPLGEAAARVLSEALVADEDLPAFPRSAMDGFAVRAADVAAASEAAPVWLALVGSVEMGFRPAREVGAGEAMAIPTGGYLPDGADAVVPMELTETRAEEVGVRASASPGRNVVERGEDLARGAEVLPAGRRLGATEIAALAGLGQTQVPVHRRARVVVLSSGTELCAPDELPHAGQVRDVNRSALSVLAAGAGCAVSSGGQILPDEPGALEHALRAALAAADVVIVSGGSSVGGRDHTGEVFARLGELLFHGIAVRPGRPTLAARAGDTLLIGLPGVPAAALVMFEAFVRPLLRRLGGEQTPPRWSLTARLTSAQTSTAGREDYLRVRLIDQDGELWAEPLGARLSALSGLLTADALVILPADAEALAEGSRVAVLPLR